jgi:hypothetical protein
MTATQMYFSFVPPQRLPSFKKLCQSLGMSDGPRVSQCESCPCVYRADLFSKCPNCGGFSAKPVENYRLDERQLEE